MCPFLYLRLTLDKKLSMVILKFFWKILSFLIHLKKIFEKSPFFQKLHTFFNFQKYFDLVRFLVNPMKKDLTNYFWIYFQKNVFKSFTTHYILHFFLCFEAIELFSTFSTKIKVLILSTQISKKCVLRKLHFYQKS